MVDSNLLIHLADKYDNKYNGLCLLNIMKLAYIRKTPDGKYRVLSEKGKHLGTYRSKEQAEKRLKQIEYFKHKKKKKASDINPECVDLTELDNLSYSAVMRELRQQCDNEAVLFFLNTFKSVFDKLIFDGQEHPAEKALPLTIILFGKKYPVELNHD